ncbi:MULTISPECIES: hypothetical protein [Weeksella]|uniref:hypothetical protein n=1 Tax=Weeksella TaxID=1013 RepID=UPI0008A44DF5|nr:MULTISPECIES: hypothetical protein [Weeksella]MDK7376054.1 hypothetical protein [Weeksella virosa]OFM84558.1 hypothetical protein HMPREF2660_08590 [Weeksella sp. HMSC059D05]
MYQTNHPSKFLCQLIFYYKDSSVVPIPLHHPNNHENGFYNSSVKGKSDSVRLDIGSFRFSEEFQENRAGGFYTQKLNFRIKSSAINRAKLLENIKNVRLIGLVYKDGTEKIFGRNDRIQNSKPELSTHSDENFTEINFSCNAIMPITDKFTVNTGYTYTYSFSYF